MYLTWDDCREVASGDISDIIWICQCTYLCLKVDVNVDCGWCFNQMFICCVVECLLWSISHRAMTYNKLTSCQLYCVIHTIGNAKHSMHKYVVKYDFTALSSPCDVWIWLWIVVWGRWFTSNAHPRHSSSWSMMFLEATEMILSKCCSPLTITLVVYIRCLVEC